MSHSTPQIFQLEQDDIDRSSTLEQSDLGKWCYVVQGYIQGFFDTQDEAKESRDAVFHWSSAS